MRPISRGFTALFSLLVFTFVSHARAGEDLPSGKPDAVESGQRAQTDAELSGAAIFDLQGALSRALELSPDFDTTVRTAHNAKLSRKNAFWSMFPELDLQANHQYQNQGGANYLPIADYPHAPWSNDLAATVTENLYDNGVTLRTYEISALQEQIGTVSVLKGRQDLILKVAKAFYDYSSSFAALDLQRQQNEALKGQLRTIEGRYRQGMSSNRDYLRIKLQVQRAEISLTTSLANLEDTTAALREAMGERGLVRFKPFTMEPKRLEGLTFPQPTPEDSYDYRIANLQNQVSNLTYQNAVRDNLPRLTLKASYTYQTNEYLGPRIASAPGFPSPDDPSWNATGQIILDWALWDWGIRGRKLEIADNQKQIDYDAQNTVRLTVNQSLIRLQLQAQQYLKSFRESLQVLSGEQQTYEILDRGYREGKVTYLDLITALDELYNARSQTVDLEFRLLKAKADLAYYQGNLDEALKNQ